MDTETEKVELKNPVALNPQAGEFETMQRQCKMAVMSGFLPDAYQQGDANVQMAKACVVAMKGRELGVPMMQAFSQINVIKGKPAISAELMLALIYRAHPDANIDFVRYDSEGCTIMAGRPGKTPRPFSFDEEDARKAGLLGNQNYKKYARAMYRSRAISEMARSVFPDAIMGCSYTPEELGANVNDEGEVKDVTPTAGANQAMSGGPRVSQPSVEPEPINTTAKPASTETRDHSLGPTDIGSGECVGEPPNIDLPNFAPGADNPPTAEQRQQQAVGVAPTDMRDPVGVTRPAPVVRQEERARSAVTGQPMESREDKAARLAKFVPKGGKFKGQALGDCVPQDLAMWLKWCKDNNNGGKIVDIVQEYLESAYGFDPNFMHNKDEVDRQFGADEPDYDSPMTEEDIPQEFR